MHVETREEQDLGTKGKPVVKSTDFSRSPSLVTPQLCDLGQVSGPQFSHLVNGECKIFVSGC